MGIPDRAERYSKNSVVFFIERNRDRFFHEMIMLRIWKEFYRASAVIIIKELLEEPLIGETTQNSREIAIFALWSQIEDTH